MSENETSEGEGSAKRLREGTLSQGQGSSGGPQSGTIPKVDSPGGGASPSAIRAKSSTTRTAVDLSIAMPHPAANQLRDSQVAGIGGIGEPGDMSTGPGTNQVDTGGSARGNIPGAPGAISGKTDSPVMTVSRTVRRKLRPGA